MKDTIVTKLLLKTLGKILDENSKAFNTIEIYIEKEKSIILREACFLFRLTKKEIISWISLSIGSIYHRRFQI